MNLLLKGHYHSIINRTLVLAAHWPLLERRLFLHRYLSKRRRINQCFNLGNDCTDSVLTLLLWMAAITRVQWYRFVKDHDYLRVESLHCLQFVFVLKSSNINFRYRLLLYGATFLQNFYVTEDFMLKLFYLIYFSQFVPCLLYEVS